MANGTQNPYVGIDSFREEDSDYFFGRDEESRQLTSLLIAHQVVLFYAQSGAGKTSLLQAQVIPSLGHQEEIEVLPIARVGGELPTGVRPANVYVFNALYSMAEAGTDPQMLAEVGLRDGLGRYLERPSDEDDTGPVLLVVDQFEELFTSYPERYEERTGFFLQVRECLEAYPHLGLLICMREDFIAPLDFYAALVPDRLRIRYRMERLDQHQARAAVERPAARAGRPFEAGVAQTLVDDLRQIQLAPTTGAIEPEQHPLGAYVEPLYLQIVCQRLWEGLAPGKKIRPEDVKELGDVDQALIDLYEESLDKALREVKDTDCDQGRLRDWFEEELITPAGTRGLVFRGEKETGGVPNRAVDVLSQAYVLRRIPRGDDVWYELAHDRLVAPIQRSNRSWREARAQRAPLLAQAEKWKQQGGADDGLLLQGPALAEARNWFEAHPRDLSRLEQALIQEFLEASENAIHLQAARRQRRWLQVAALLMVVFAALAAWALYSQHRAREAQQETESALSAAMTAERDARSALSTATAALDAMYAQGTSEAAARQQAEDLLISQNETAVAQAESEQAAQQADLEATLVALAVTSTATPTPTPTPTQRPSATPGPTRPGDTPTPIPTRTPTPTVTRSPTPDWAATDTAAAVSTQVAQVQATQTAIARCPFEPQGEFSKLWQQEGVPVRLGCPKYVNPVNTYMAEQAFNARGMMYWSQTPDLYLVLMGQRMGTWQVFWTKDIWWSWNPAGVSCEPEVPPGPGEVQPVRGFGGLWCANPKIQQALGFATEKERGVSGNWLQEFERGFILRDSTGTDYLLFADRMIYSTAAALPQPTATPRPTVAIPDMVFVPGGTLSIGRPEEGEPKQVDVSGFWLDQYEVTNVEYKKCVEARRCRPPHRENGAPEVMSQTREDYYTNPRFDRFPVIFVDWVDARTYCNWVDKRLPTEAEWEWAAKGLKNYEYPWGSESPSPSRANYNGKDTRQVGLYEPTVLGLYDMAGNVWEWTSSLTWEYAQLAPGGREDPEAKGDRILRGGSWVDENLDNLRTTKRDPRRPGGSLANVGFRCAMSPESP